MKISSFRAALALAAATAAPQLSVAAEKTVVLAVPGMYCTACPIGVRKALEKVPGVAKVKATYEPKEAVVTFDDTRANTDKLIEAVKNAGYKEASVKQWVHSAGTK